MPCLALAAEVS